MPRRTVQHHHVCTRTPCWLNVSFRSQRCHCSESCACTMHVTLPSTTWDSARHTPASAYLLSTLRTFNVVCSTTLYRGNVGALVIWDPCWTSSQHKSSYHDQHHLSRASQLGCVYIKLGQSKLFARVSASVQFICGASTGVQSISVKSINDPILARTKQKRGYGITIRPILWLGAG